MNFKDVVGKDIVNTFLNPLEFATEHTLNNRVVKCIIDEENFQNKQKKGLLASEEGVFYNGFTLFIGKPYINTRPNTGEKIKIDDVTYEVAASKDDMEMYEIDLFEYRDY